MTKPDSPAAPAIRDDSCAPSLLAAAWLEAWKEAAHAAVEAHADSVARWLQFQPPQWNWAQGALDVMVRQVTDAQRALWLHLLAITTAEQATDSWEGAGAALFRELGEAAERLVHSQAQWAQDFACGSG